MVGRALERGNAPALSGSGDAALQLIGGTTAMPPVIMPSFFIGTRYMAEVTHDGYARAREFGVADLFITMTAFDKPSG